MPQPGESLGLGEPPYCIHAPTRGIIRTWRRTAHAAPTQPGESLILGEPPYCIHAPTRGSLILGEEQHMPPQPNQVNH